ncbi:hypothetical protein QAD02_007918 [Eretmocerus hayati]|uniref:Uncharacterized protein n=1 Tax=Eretmocerus hayati TaxID=131215 RepID=A0ACC2N5U0_9HYME|nr:hypothetical protein QAD02_007918 [Eretmocerus hayati]
MLFETDFFPDENTTCVFSTGVASEEVMTSSSSSRENVFAVFITHFYGDRVKFNPDWMTWPQYKDWLKEDETYVYGASCFICRRKFKLSNMGVSSLDSHAKVNRPSRKPCASSSTAENPDTGRVLGKDVNERTINTLNKLNTSKMTTFLPKDEVTKSEIKWCLISAKLHLSNNTSSECIEGVKDIFETSCNRQESGLAEAMKLGKDKISYMTKYGLGPYFAQNTIEGIKKSDVYSVSFDEAFNKNIQKTQMDIYGRFWHAGLNRAVTKYLDFKEDFEIENSTVCKLFDVGSCGLHAVHNSLKTGFESSPGKVHEFLKAKYYLFNGCAPRQGDFKKFTGTEVSNEKFCPIRWAGNVHAAQKAQAEIDDLQKYVTGS